MTLDPTVAAAIVTAAGGLLQKLLEFAGRSPSDTRTEKVISAVYEKIADAVSPNSLRVLIVLHDTGTFQLPEQIVAPAQGLVKQQESNGRPFEPDITYRLRYLCLLGLVRAGTSDFAVTKLGAEFIEYARRDKHRYAKVFAKLGT